MQAGKSQDVIYEKLTGNISSDNFLKLFQNTLVSPHFESHKCFESNQFETYLLKPGWRL